MSVHCDQDAAVILARAVLVSAYQIDVTEEYNVCLHCGNAALEERGVETIEHASDCPVLVAKSLASASLTTEAHAHAKQ